MKNYPLYPAHNYETFDGFLRGIANFGDAPAISWFDRKQNAYQKTYREVSAEALSLSRTLRQMDMTGKHIAIVSENSYLWLLAFFGITAAGATAICVDIEQPDATIRELIARADGSMIFTSQTFSDICAPMDLPTYTLLPTAEENSILSLMESGKTLPETPLDINTEQTAAIIFTSGTTSKAKPVELTHKNLMSNACTSMAFVKFGPTVFSSLPLFHSYGLTCAVLNSLSAGRSLTINGDLRTMMRDLTLSKPSTVIAVPLMVEALYGALWGALEKMGEAQRIKQMLKNGRTFRKLGIPYGGKELTETKNKILGPLSLLIVGGAHMDPNISEALDAFGIQVLQGYGITECSPLISVNRNEACVFDSVGLVLPGCEVKIQDGEIWAKGPNIMKGYYKDPKATAEVFSDGYFKTGDLGSIDKDGFLSITGRIKNLIVLKNGKKISPEKIEELIAAIPMVKDVMVYGATSGASADEVRPAASIYPDPAHTAGLSSYEILEHLQGEINKINATLPTYQQVQMVNIREKEFDKTSSKKIKRHQM